MNLKSKAEESREQLYQSHILVFPGNLPDTRADYQCYSLFSAGLLRDRRARAFSSGLFCSMLFLFTSCALHATYSCSTVVGPGYTCFYLFNFKSGISKSIHRIVYIYANTSKVYHIHKSLFCLLIRLTSKNYLLIILTCFI